MKTKLVLLPVILFLSFSIFSCNQDEAIEATTSNQLSDLKKKCEFCHEGGDNVPTLAWINACGRIVRSSTKPKNRICRTIYESDRIIRIYDNWRLF